MTKALARELTELLLKAFLCAWLSAQAVLHVPSGHYWGPGLAFALLILPLRYGYKPLLLAAVTASYALGMLSMDLLPPQTEFATYLQAPALGSLALALVLHWMGALGWRRASAVALAGSLLGPWFWIIIGSGELEWLRQDHAWVLAFFLWQAPMAVVLSYRRSDDTLKGTP